MKDFGKKISAIIGQEIVYSDKTKKNVKGTATKVRHSMAYIKNMKTGKEYPAVEVLIKPIDGGRAFWSRPFKNE